jgi:hypothetical protein
MGAMPMTPVFLQIFHYTIEQRFQTLLRLPLAFTQKALKWYD